MAEAVKAPVADSIPDKTAEPAVEAPPANGASTESKDTEQPDSKADSAETQEKGENNNSTVSILTSNAREFLANLY